MDASAIQEYKELIAKVELGTTTPKDNVRWFQLENEYGLYHSRLAWSSPHARKTIAQVVRQIESEQRQAAEEILRKGSHRNSAPAKPEFWLVEDETPTQISFKIISTVRGFRWNGSVNTTGRAMTDDEKANARAWAQGVLAEAMRDPYADRFHVR